MIVDEGDGAEQFERYAGVLGKAGPCAPVPVLVPVGGRFEPEGVLDDVDGLLVCGGLTPAYQEAFVECLDRLPRLLAFWQLPAGVYSTLVGYQGGYTEHPMYEEVCSGLGAGRP